MCTYTDSTQEHGQPSNQGKQGARKGARGTRTQGCTGAALSIERAPVPRERFFR